MAAKGSRRRSQTQRRPARIVVFFSGANRPTTIRRFFGPFALRTGGKVVFASFFNRELSSRVAMEQIPLP